MVKRLIGIALAFAAGFAGLAVYRGRAVVDRAELQTGNAASALAVLESGLGTVPWNDRLYHALAQARFQSGVRRLQDAPNRDADFRAAHRDYLRALALNPLSAKIHFDFAQALRYMSFFDLGIAEDYLDEFKKAARLSGGDPQICGEAGKVMFARWEKLSPEDREYAQTVVRSFLRESRTVQDIESFLGLWELNVKDPAVLDRILPRDADIDRQVARFLGERSLSRDERVRFQIQAEVLDFQTARDEFAAGQRAIGGLKIEEARRRFRNSRASLERIVFAQSLGGKDLIDRLEYRDLVKSVRLGLAKCSLEETRRLDDALEDLTAYLDLEDKPAAIGELELFLRERNIISSQADIDVQDFGRFLFEVLLAFKQSRFREVIQAGQALERSLLVIPDSLRPKYVRLLEIIGDSYRKLDYLYESNAFYAKSLEMGGGDIDLLLKLRKNYERLNDREKMAGVDASIRKLLPLREEDVSRTVLDKDAPLVREYALDGRKIGLTVVFESLGPDPAPLISALYNGQLVWEDYLEGTDLSLTLPSEIGRNSLEIRTANRSIGVTKIRIVLEEVEAPPETER